MEIIFTFNYYICDFTKTKNKTKQNNSKQKQKNPENRSLKVRIWCAVVNQTYMCHLCKKKKKDSNFYNGFMVKKVSTFH